MTSDAASEHGRVLVRILIDSGLVERALDALVLLPVNVVCVNIAAQAIFAYAGIRPRPWAEKQAGVAARRTHAIAWVTLSALLVGAIVLMSSRS